MKAIDFDDMDCCSGTEKQPHPAVWFYRPEQEVPDGEFHMKLEQVGHCPVCVILNHVIPVFTITLDEATKTKLNVANLSGGDVVVRGELETKP